MLQAKVTACQVRGVGRVLPGRTKVIMLQEIALLVNMHKVVFIESAHRVLSVQTSATFVLGGKS